MLLPFSRSHSRVVVRVGIKKSENVDGIGKASQETVSERYFAHRKYVCLVRARHRSMQWTWKKD